MGELAKIAMIVAGGQGQRMGSQVPKQFLHLRGIPLVCHSMNVFAGLWEDLEFILVVPPGYVHMEPAIICGLVRPAKVSWVEGGETRFQSVKNGLTLVNKPSVIFVHDGARPLITPALVNRCYDQTREKGSAIPVIPLTESIRQIGISGNRSVDRKDFRITQTPQTFLSEILLPAFAQEYRPAFTDEASVLESSGVPVHLVEGEENNIKVTRPLDLALAERILAGTAF